MKKQISIGKELIWKRREGIDSHERKEKERKGEIEEVKEEKILSHFKLLAQNETCKSLPCSQVSYPKLKKKKKENTSDPPCANKGPAKSFVQQK